MGRRSERFVENDGMMVLTVECFGYTNDRELL